MKDEDILNVLSFSNLVHDLAAEMLVRNILSTDTGIPKDTSQRVNTVIEREEFEELFLNTVKSFVSPSDWVAYKRVQEDLITAVDSFVGRFAPKIAEEFGVKLSENDHVVH